MRVVCAYMQYLFMFVPVRLAKVLRRDVKKDFLWSNTFLNHILLFPKLAWIELAEYSSPLNEKKLQSKEVYVIHPH